MDSPLSDTLGLRGNFFLQSSGDFQSERKRLNKKLGKLRSDLNISVKDTKNYRSKEKVSLLSSVDYDNNPLFGKVLLLTAERDVLYALELKNYIESSASTKTSHIISKYKKAMKSGKKLIKITENEKNLTKKIEVVVYVSLIQGQLSILQRKWSTAIDSLSISRFLLKFLGGDNSKFGDKSLITDILENTVDPSLKLSILKNTGEKNPDLNFFTKKNFQFNTLPFLSNILNEILLIEPDLIKIEEEELLKSIEWRNYTANLKSEEISRLISKVITLQDTIEISGLSGDSVKYDPILLAWQELLDLHSVELSKNLDDIDEEEYQDNQVLLVYIKYNLLINKAKRDLSIIDELKVTLDENRISDKKTLEINRDMARILDNILLTIHQIRELPSVDKDDDLVSTLGSLENYFKSFKVSLIGGSYYLKRKFKQSLLLFDESFKMISSLKHFEIDLKLVSTDEVVSLKKYVEEKLKYSHILTQYDQEKSGNSNNLVIDSIDTYPCGTTDKVLSNLATIKPTLNSVSVKPVLFDIAYNYIDYNDSTPSTKPIESLAGEKSTNFSTDENNDKKRGFFGIFGR